MKTGPIVRASAEAIIEGAEALRAGQLVAFPTETVYGLGADATNDAAVARIFAAKGRPEINPLIVHFADAHGASNEVEWSALADALAGRFWPGPLTLILRRRAASSLSLLVSAGLDTVGVRLPNHPLAKALLECVARPVAAPSANPSGLVSPTSAEHVRDSLGGAVAAILDGGSCPLGIESTVLDLSGARPAILRPGSITAEALEEVVGRLDAPRPNGPVKSPGTVGRHYAIRAPLRLAATHARDGETLLAFGPGAPEDALNLSATGDLEEAAANLFAMLRVLDRAESGTIAIMPIPESGLGRAINDRLRRAAHAHAYAQDQDQDHAQDQDQDQDQDDGM